LLNGGKLTTQNFKPTIAMAKIFNHLSDSTDPNIITGRVVNVNFSNVYPSGLTATSTGTSLGIQLLSNYDRFDVAQTSASTDFILLPTADAPIGSRIVFYATSAFSLKAGADASTYTINGAADTAKYLVPSGTLVVIEKATSTNWIASVVGAGDGEGQTQVAEVSITNAQMLALRATPITLVAAQGAGRVIEFVSAQLFFDYTAAYTETADNMAVRLNNTTGAIVSQAIEATGFVDSTADVITNALPKIDTIVAGASAANLPLVLHNTGDGEYGGGNAANILRVKTVYRVWSTGF
jgi:hypothetical protein